jgi:hypothetical protein
MGQGRLAVRIGGAAAIAVAVLACRQLVGIGDEPPPGPAGTATDAGAEAGFTYGQGDCAMCVATSCGPQATLCAGTASCAALEGCMSAANGDATMRAQCGVTWGLGNDSATPDFEACLASNCETQCGLTCGGLAAVFPPATATQCQQCIVKSECPATTDCATKPLCQKAVRCQFSSDTLDVQQACPAIAPDSGANPYLPVQNSPIASTCSAECSWGSDWSCLGKVDWPTYNYGSFLVDTFVYGPTQKGVAGVTAKLCDTVDPMCAPPFDMRPTDDAGTVPLTHPPSTEAGLFYLDVSSDAIQPALLFDMFPIHASRIAIPFPVSPPGSIGADADGLGVPFDDSLGSLILVAVDCRLAFAPGVHFTVTPTTSTTAVAYLKGQLPALGLTETDSSGTAVFVNLPVLPTHLHLTATVPALGRTMADTQVFARDGGVSEVYVVPNQ